MSDPITLRLPDGSVREVERGTTALEVAASIGPRLARDAVGAAVDGRTVDLRQPLAEGGDLRLITADSPEAGDFIRHSAEHVLADAVKRLWPGTEIDVGRQDHSEKFQYDFRFPRAFSPEDLEKIEAKMAEILREDLRFERIEVSREEAEDILRELGEGLKIERLKDIPEGEAITLFRHGPFTDLCRGPHVQRTSQIKAVKLLEASGVYWKGDERNDMLQRIYGTAFASAADLASYLEAVERARARDHRKLGPELDLFSFDEHSPASPFFHPHGAVVYNGLVDLVRELYRRHGYQEVITPQILDVDLWHTSGHYEHYRNAMYFTEVEGRQFAVKPMNCPAHCLIYATRLRSYRDLPVRYADFGRLHRNERSGVTSGLTRVRSFAQDDAHIFCTTDQIEAEVMAVVEMIQELYDTFGFEDVDIELSTRPEKALGSAEMWERAEEALRSALDRHGIEYRLAPGEGAFYGPKVDFHVQDALGRSWQLGTVQLDFQLPERFALSYVGADGGEHRPVLIHRAMLGSLERFIGPPVGAAGGEHRPVLIHRAMLGSLERFIGILVEHTGGAFPVWLAPVQAVVLPVSEKFLDYADGVRRRLAEAGARVELDGRSEKLGYKIRDAQVRKVPYMLVVGAREAEAGQVALRLRTGEDLGAIGVDEAVARWRRAAETRSLEL